MNGRMLRVGLLGLLVTLLGAACGSDDPTPAEARTACKNDPSSRCCGDSDCRSIEACDFSLVCAQGSDHEVTCDAPSGDRQCHLRCSAQVACPAGLACKPVAIFQANDTPTDVSFCVAP